MRIDFVHDIACPFSRIGKLHLNQVLAQWRQPEPIEVFYRAYLLDPDIPPAGENFIDYMNARSKHKGRADDEAITGVFDQIAAIGRAEGLNYRFDKIEYAPNTLLAHRFIYLMPRARQSEVLEAVYDAYFEHGVNIGNVDALLSIAHACGIDAREIRAPLTGDAQARQIYDDDQWARTIGVTAVPTLVVNERVLIKASQPPAAIAAQLAEQLAG